MGKNKKNKKKAVKSLILDDEIVETKVTKKEVKEMIDEVVEEPEMESEEDEEEDEIEFQGQETPRDIQITKLATVAAVPSDYPETLFVAKVASKAKSADDEAEVTAADEVVDVRETEDRTIFVKNLPYDVTKELLNTLFINATEIRLLTKNNGQCRGKAFIEMATVAHAESAAAYHKWELSGRKLEVDLCGSKSKTSESRAKLESATLSLKGNIELDAEDLKDLFDEPCAIRIPKSGMNIVYVQFEDVETAKKYMEQELEVNGTTLATAFVPDRISAERKPREKGEKWQKKQEAKRKAFGDSNGSAKRVKTEENAESKAEHGDKEIKREFGKREASGRGGFGRGRGGGRGGDRGRGRGFGNRGGDRGRGGSRGRGDRGGGRGYGGSDRGRGGSRGGGDRGRGHSRGRGGSDRGGPRGRGGDRGGRGGSRGRGDTRGRGSARGGGDRGGARGRGFSKPSGPFKRD